MGNWRKRVYDQIIEATTEWLYDTERNEYRSTTTYYGFGSTAIDRYRSDPQFHCRVQALAARIIPILEIAFSSFMSEMKERYEK